MIIHSVHLSNRMAEYNIGARMAAATRCGFLLCPLMRTWHLQSDTTHNMNQTTYRMDSTLAFFVEEIRREPPILPVTEFSDPVASHHHFKFRIAQNHHHHNSANKLIDRMYSWRGYETGRIMAHGMDKTTIIAYSNENAVGTLSISSDSDMGLLADQLYHEELNALRSRGCSLCEFRGLAVDAGIRSKRMLASLFHIGYLYPYCTSHHTDGVLEVNPRHAGFYEKRLGFTRIGPEKICHRVNAPAVLMRTNFSYMAEQVKGFGGLMDEAIDEKSLYPYFFSEAEETEILDRLINCSS